MNLGTWILSLVQPLLGRILTALGFSVVTITGLEAILDQLKAQLVTAMNGIGADMLNVFLLSGGGVGLGLIVGAITTRLLIWQLQQGTKILGVNPG